MLVAQINMFSSCTGQRFFMTKYATLSKEFGYCTNLIGDIFRVPSQYQILVAEFLVTRKSPNVIRSPCACNRNSICVYNILFGVGISPFYWTASFETKMKHFFSLQMLLPCFCMLILEKWMLIRSSLAVNLEPHIYLHSWCKFVLPLIT